MRCTRNRAGLAISLLAVVTFALLADAVVTGATGRWDNAIRDAFHHTARPYLTWIAIHVSWLGKVATLISATLVTASIFLLKGRHLAALALSIDMGGALLLDGTLKIALHRSRPEPFIGVNPETFSFPSGHVLLGACFCGGLLLVLAYSSKARALATLTSLATILAIGWSRIYLGAHYPSDVAGGLLVATFWLGTLVGLGLFKAASPGTTESSR